MTGQSSEGVPGNPISSALLCRLLGLDEDEPAYRLVQEARRQSGQLPALVLSALQAEGCELGTGSRDELRRAALRTAVYGEIAGQLGRGTAARVMKGPSIAARYPRGIQRAFADLDVIVTDEACLWETVRIVTGMQPGCSAMISTCGSPPGHFIVTLEWPGEDPVLDGPYAVEICTAAFYGDEHAVGIRPVLPADPVAADLLQLAEERFQRPFGAKDIVDVAVLSAAPALDIGELARCAEEYRLAPELGELLQMAGEHIDIGPFRELRELAADVAGAELTRRASGHVDPYTRHGYPLEERAWDGGFAPATVHCWDGGSILRTPVGDYLLVEGAVVSRALHARALREHEKLRAGSVTA